MNDLERQHLVDKQRGRCASCRCKLPAEFCVRRDFYPMHDGNAIAAFIAQCPPCFGARRPRADGYVPGTPHDEFFAQFHCRRRS